MAICKFCDQKFDHDVEKYCCYWCELHGKMQDHIIKRLELKKKSMQDTNNPKIASGLSEAILIVKKEFYAKK